MSENNSLSGTREIATQLLTVMQDSKTHISNKVFVMGGIAEIISEVNKLNFTYHCYEIVEFFTGISNTLLRIDAIARALDEGKDIKEVNCSDIFIDGELSDIQYTINLITLFIVKLFEINNVMVNRLNEIGIDTVRAL